MAEFDYEKFKKDNPSIIIPKEKEECFLKCANTLADIFNLMDNKGDSNEQSS